MMKRGLPKVKPIPDVKNIILIASGKGGVGKSTTTGKMCYLQNSICLQCNIYDFTVNLAAAVKSLNYEVGVLDTDVFGPTIPLMMNLNETPFLNKDNLMEPLINYGIKWYVAKINMIVTNILLACLWVF